MHFSSLAGNLTGEQNPLYALHARLTREGGRIVDLVRGNVNAHGVIFPPALLDEILREAAEPARVYRPDSFGQPVAREAIARYYGMPQIAPSRILLTPGTSVSYWYCFQLLAERGDEILVPQPSYPLFDYIAAMCGVELKPYRLVEARGWAIDLEDLESRIGDKTRGIILISPHNPTGMVASDDELRALAQIASRHELPIISDEVFGEFLFDMDRLPRPAATAAPLVFTLNGLSKMFALPGMKIGWIAVSGEPELVRRSLAALEMVSDTFLPVNEIAQFSVPGIFERGAPFLLGYREWIEGCRNAALSGLSAGMSGGEFVPPKGGFYVALPCAREKARDEEITALRLLEEHGILTHPGHFYEIDGDHLVMTFIEDPQRLRSVFETIAAVSG